MKYRGFDSLVRDIMNTPELPDDQYIRVARIAKNVVKNLGMVALPGTVKTFKGKVNDNLTVDVHPDILEIYKVGLFMSQEDRMLILGNRKLYKPDRIEGCTCGGDVYADSTCAACTFHGYYESNQYGELYGMYTGKFRAWWEYDEEENQIVVSGLSKDEVVVYEGKVSGDFNLIPDLAYMLIEAKVLEKYYSNKPGLKESYHLDATRELRTYKRYKIPSSAEEIQQLLQGTYKRAKY